MKNAIRLGIALIVLLLALTSCNLYNEINLGWTIDSFALASGSTFINYTATNYGKYDLTGVNLQFTVDINGDKYFDPLPPTSEPSAWTPDFSLSQGQSYSSSITITHAGTGFGVAVTDTDMDKPRLVGVTGG
jgi:hypothetical protein